VAAGAPVEDPLAGWVAELADPLAEWVAELEPPVVEAALLGRVKEIESVVVALEVAERPAAEHSACWRASAVWSSVGVQ